MGDRIKSPGIPPPWVPVPPTNPCRHHGIPGLASSGWDETVLLFRIMVRASGRAAVVMAAVIGGTAMLSACAASDGATSSETEATALSPGEVAGAGVGAVAGGATAALVGADPTGIVAGVIVGLIAGGYAGGQFGDEPEPASDTYSAIDTLKTGETRNWRDPETGRINSTTVERIFTRRDGSVCKEYTEKRPAGDGMAASTGTACKPPDSDWRGAAAPA